MKKVMSLLLAVMMILSMSACGGNENTTDNNTGSSITNISGVSDDTNTSSSTTSKPTSTTPETSKPTTTTKPSAPIHSHNYSEATCTEPAKCSCGVTNGSALGHSYDNGICKRCNEKDPNYKPPIQKIDTNTSSSTTSKPTTTTKPETTKPSTPAHTHSYSDATCTAPAKCSCGATKGSALGHKWQDATCQAPKTCSVCKTIEGNKLKHTYDEDGICSLCKSKDPNFKYPAVSSMDGNWKSVHKQENYLCELTYHFTLNPPKDLLPFGAGEWGYFPEEEIQLENNESLDDYESIVWTDGKTYYKLGGGMVMEGIFEESDDKVIVTDYYSNNKKMVLQRISTNRMKVISFDSQIEYVNIPIGTILTFCEK